LRESVRYFYFTCTNFWDYIQKFVQVSSNQCIYMNHGGGGLQ